jgi:hypothetical protein
VQGIFKNRNSMPLAEVLADEFVPTEDAIWLFYKTLEEAREKRWVKWFGCWCVWQIAHLLKDRRTIEVLRVAQRHVRGRASKEEQAAAKKTLMAARVGESSAWDAVYDVFWLTQTTAKATRLNPGITAFRSAAASYSTQDRYREARIKQRQMAIRIAKHLDKATT